MIVTNQGRCPKLSQGLVTALLYCCLCFVLPPWTGAQVTQPADDGPPADVATTSRPSSEATRELVARLGSPRFQDRERAQGELSRLGEAALPILLEYISDKDPEIASRVRALIVRPRDPRLRVRTAVRLIATTDEDLMEMGVYMAFEDPLVDYQPFAKRLAEFSGIERAVLEPVAQQLKEWKEATERFNINCDRWIKEGKSEVVEKHRALHRESMYYQAEAAYWQAVDAALDFGKPGPAAGKTTTRPSPTSQRAE